MTFLRVSRLRGMRGKRRGRERRGGKPTAYDAKPIQHIGIKFGELVDNCKLINLV